MMIALAIAPVSMVTSAAYGKSAAYLIVGSVPRLPLMSFSDSFQASSGKANQTAQRASLLTVVYRFPRGAANPMQSLIAAKRVKSLKIALETGSGSGAPTVYTFDNDRIQTISIVTKGPQTQATLVFVYTKVSLDGGTSASIHPHPWKLGD
jgi:hypothetical protein